MNHMEMKMMTNGKALSFDKSLDYSSARTIGGTSFDGTGNITPAQATNADTVDSLHASSFLRSDAGDTFSGDLTSSGSARILLKKTDNNLADHIIFYNGTTRIGEIGVQDDTW